MSTVPSSRYSADARWETFERVRRAFWWTVAGSCAAAAAIFGAVSHQIPGKSSAPTQVAVNPGTGNTGVVGAGNTGVSNSGNTGNTGAVSAPVPTQQAPTAVSGGSGW